MYLPPSRGQNFGTGKRVRSISPSRNEISQTGARSRGTRIGAMRRRRILRVAAIFSPVVSAGSRPTVSAYRSSLAPNMLVRMRELLGSSFMRRNRKAPEPRRLAPSKVMADSS